MNCSSCRGRGGCPALYTCQVPIQDPVVSTPCVAFAVFGIVLAVLVLCAAAFCWSVS